MLNHYYRLAKPGIVYGNLVNVLTGFLLAALLLHRFNVITCIIMLIGSGLVIASGCVFNNYMDRAIDAKMARTKQRELVKGRVSVVAALAYGAVLGGVGFALLAAYTNWLTVACALFGLVSYVFLYGYFKRTSVYGTLVGSISGAMPPVGGYVAVTNHLDAASLSIFLMLVLWQVPHFYAIATFRHDDYAAAGLPVWPVKKGMLSAKKQITYYIAAFALASLLLSLYRYTGITYAIVMSGLSLAWLRLALRGFHASDTARWARQVFRFSLVITLAMAIMIPLGVVLP